LADQACDSGRMGGETRTVGVKKIGSAVSTFCSSTTQSRTAEIAEKIRGDRREMLIGHIGLFQRSLRGVSAASVVNFLEFLFSVVHRDVLIMVHHPLDPIFQRDDVEVNKESDLQIEQP